MSDDSSGPTLTFTARVVARRHCDVVIHLPSTYRQDIEEAVTQRFLQWLNSPCNNGDSGATHMDRLPCLYFIPVNREWFSWTRKFCCVSLETDTATKYSRRSCHTVTVATSNTTSTTGTTMAARWPSPSLATTLEERIHRSQVLLVEVALRGFYH